GEVGGGVVEGRPDERAVGPGTDGEVARYLVGTGHRDPDGEAAALVGVASEAAVLVPGHVRDAFDDTDRLEERLDTVVAPGTEDVTVSGDLGQAEEPPVCDQRPRRRRLLVEGLHPDELPVAPGRLRPPRVTVVGRVSRSSAVHVRRDRVLLPAGEV